MVGSGPAGFDGAARPQPADGRYARWRVIGVETADVAAEHKRLSALGGVDLDDFMEEVDGVPPMFALRDPDGNSIWVVQT